MESRFFVADSAGLIKRAGEGCGFALLPGRPAASKTVRPGSFPVRVRTREGKVIEVTGPHSYYFLDEVNARRQGFDVEGAVAGEGWNVVAFNDPIEGVRGGAGRVRVTSRVQSATAAGTAAPANGDTSGFIVRPGTQSWTAYAAGVLQVARVWVQDLDGVWTDTLEDLDFVSTPVITRIVDATGRVYLRSAAATLTLALDVMEEVG